ncbi:ferritin family protein [Streptomyces sp. NBC_00376]|uniref:ferritin family protein n=2 Tax=unclassified Streptomyces TaxID=2593676 RepID=UPI002E1BBB4D
MALGGEMYRRFAEQARADGDLRAAKLFSEIAADEGRHRDAFRTALTAVTTGHGAIPAPPKADVVPVPAGLPKVKAARTKANLDTALHGEAHAHARQTGNTPLARLWEGAAKVELNEHFAGEAVLAGLVRTTRENLRRAIIGEHNEATTAYPGFAKRATAVGDTAAARYWRNTAAASPSEFCRRLDTDADFAGWFEPLSDGIRELASSTRPHPRLVRLQAALMDLIDFLDPNADRFPDHRRSRLGLPARGTAPIRPRW